MAVVCSQGSHSGSDPSHTPSLNPTREQTSLLPPKLVWSVCFGKSIPFQTSLLNSNRAAQCGLNLISGLNWLWFSAIAAQGMQSTITVFTSLTVLQATEEFDISLQEINWLGTCVNVAYLPMSILVPLSLNRWGMRASVRILHLHTIAYQLQFRSVLSARSS